MYKLRIQLNLEDIEQKDTLFIVCDIWNWEAIQKRFCIRQGSSETAFLNYLKNLAADIKNTPDDLWKEKVYLCVGDDIVVVNKAVLCSRSPVFARMLESDMREKKENSIKIDDVNIEVIRGLVSFLYSGIVPVMDIDSLLNLYYIGSKYDITELSHECRHLLVSKFNTENVCKTLKLSLIYNDDYLKLSAMLFYGIEFKTGCNYGRMEGLND
ncbi:speckle-type POZ protein [Trichonephila clavata]|uniref:Speckle-type POZ protein n=1 Tax=Trichonephila clavata TaxID=2740835 RepID=A0A8X6J6K6_TRICU|nr:speckle-type POZ protein [Trichonephila clavata]